MSIKEMSDIINGGHHPSGPSEALVASSLNGSLILEYNGGAAISYLIK